MPSTAEMDTFARAIASWLNGKSKSLSKTLLAMAIIADHNKALYEQASEPMQVVTRNAANELQSRPKTALGAFGMCKRDDQFIQRLLAVPKENETHAMLLDVEIAQARGRFLARYATFEQLVEEELLRFVMGPDMS